MLTPWIQTIPEGKMREALEAVSEIAAACTDRFAQFEFAHAKRRLKVAEKERRAYLMGMAHGVHAAREEFEKRKTMHLYGSGALTT